MGAARQEMMDHADIEPDVVGVDFIGIAADGTARDNSVEHRRYPAAEAETRPAPPERKHREQPGIAGLLALSSSQDRAQSVRSGSKMAMTPAMSTPSARLFQPQPPHPPRFLPPFPNLP